ncbi:TIGR01777 family oxidoreductase [Neobacillus mesonae]|nr:TIGR01777 family oxidoreductase [Neobacillus mesonae]
MRFAISGGTGFIGTQLTKWWSELGHQVIIITRQASKSHASSDKEITYVTWEQIKKDPSSLESLDGVVNLAGESLNQRWTNKAKHRILESRLNSVHQLADVLDQLEHKPKVIVQSSAVGIYGTSDSQAFSESSPTETKDFLSDVCIQWERAAIQRFSFSRLAIIRTGLVLGKKGAFPLMQLPYKLGVGGPIGSGEQQVSWIHIIDMVRLIDFAVHNELISGPLNATAPHPVLNKEFGRTIGQVLHRPHWFPVPSFVLKAVLGEMSVLILEGQKVLPEKAQEHDFKFEYPDIREAVLQLHR